MKIRLSKKVISRLSMIRDRVPDVRSYDNALELCVLIATERFAVGDDREARRNRERTAAWERKKASTSPRRPVGRNKPTATENRKARSMAEVLQLLPPTAGDDDHPVRNYEHAPAPRIDYFAPSGDADPSDDAETTEDDR